MNARLNLKLTLKEVPLLVEGQEIIDLGKNKEQKFVIVPIWKQNINKDTFIKLSIQYNCLHYLNSGATISDIEKLIFFTNQNYFNGNESELKSYISQVCKQPFDKKLIFRKKKRFFYNENLIMKNYSICPSEAFKYFLKKKQQILNSERNNFTSNIEKIIEVSKLNKNTISRPVLESIIGKVGRTTLYEYMKKIKLQYPDLKIKDSSKEGIFLESIEENKKYLEENGTTVAGYLRILKSKNYSYTKLTVYNYLKKYPELQKYFKKTVIGKPIITNKKNEKNDSKDKSKELDILFEETEVLKESGMKIDLLTSYNRIHEKNNFQYNEKQR